MFIGPDQSLIVVWFARDAAGGMSRETASDQDVTSTRAESDGALCATSLRRNEGGSAAIVSL